MNVSVHSYLMAGAAAATATTLALTSVQATPDDIAVPAHSVSAEPQRSQVMVDLLAAASTMTAALPAPPMSGASRAIAAAPSAAVAAAPTALAIAPHLANTIDNIYITVEPWVRYGFELGAYALGWVPWVGGWAGGLLMDGYNFGQSLIASGVFNFTDWLRGNGSIVTNLVDFGVDVGLAFIWLGIDVASTFIPLPPLPLPPRPPLQGPFLASTLAAPTATLAAPDLRSVIGDVVLPPVGFVTGAPIIANNLLLSTSQSITGGTIAAIDPVLNDRGLGLVSRQLDINHQLLEQLSIQEFGFVNDLISVPGNYLTDVLENGQGPVRALGTQAQDVVAQDVVDSALDHGSASVDAIGNYVRDQIDFFTPGLAATDAEVSTAPESTGALLRSAEGTSDTDTTDTTEAKPARSLAKKVQDAIDKVDKVDDAVDKVDKVDKTVADVKTAGDDVRQAVKDARDGATKTSEKASDKTSEEAGETKSEPVKTAEQTAKSEKSDN
jgi:uncharacterized protein YoxC